MLGSIGDWGGMEKPSKLPSFGGKIKRGRRKGRGAGLDGGPARLRPEPRMDVRPPAGREGRRRSIVRIKVTWTLEDGATRLSEFCRVLLCVRVWYRVRLQTQENQEKFLNGNYLYGGVISGLKYCAFAMIKARKMCDVSQQNRKQ